MWGAQDKTGTLDTTRRRPSPHHQSLLSKTLLCHWGESRCVKGGRIHEETAQTAERPGKAGH